ncbi:MAG: sigma-70 family RNA polymerase sigma factor [Acidobacteria bacterium]|nr:sigma-70 family RNA polymerase sigma factor [Acidobacteriota bacterium]
MPAGADELVRLVRDAQAGDRAAFGRIYALHSRMVHGVLLSRVPSADVEDLVQDVFMLAMQRVSALRDPSSIGAWLASIARTRAIDHLRRLPRTAEMPDDVPAHDPDRSEINDIMAVIRRLPPAYRETLTLRFVEGMTGPEIAMRTGLTDGSVRVNLHRGMQQLKEQLGLLAGPQRSKGASDV